MATTQTGTIKNGTQRELMEQIFFPIVNDGLLEEFKATWGTWLVLTDKIEDQKCPGKLKIEFSTQNGEMIALAPKSYYAHCRDKNMNKDARKGVPKWYPLNLSDFHNALYHNNSKHTVEVRSLRLNTFKQMSRTTTIKRGLTGIHVKLGVQADKVTCEPLQLDGSFV